MDERLVVQFDWSKHRPNTQSLCLYAVLLARTDHDRPTTTSEEELLNMRLARVLGLGFNAQILSEIEQWDLLTLVARLHRPQLPRDRLRAARHVGDQALFVTSQDIRVGRSRQFGMSVEQVAGIGRLAYHIAARHLSRWPDGTAQNVEADLAEHFTEHQDLLDRAGHILGFDPELTELLVPFSPPVSIDDVLEALSAYGASKDLPHWERLADLANRCHWIHPEFVFDLPPRPTA